jgi:Xaa-Pro aminopeptidase
MTNPRVNQLREELRRREVPAALIMHPENVGYLSGFTGSTAALLITADRALFITDSRYTLQAGRECPGFELAITQGSGQYADRIAEEAGKLGVQEVAVEADYLTLAQFEQISKKLEQLELKPLADLVAPLRRVKDREELDRIRAACALVDRAFDYLLTLVKPGVSERDVAIELEYWMKKHGSEKEAFDSIVASGVRSALPHGRASEKLIEAGDLVTFDFGARVGGYVSDLTRTVVVGRFTEKQREVYDTVLQAQEAAIAAIRPGANGKDVDQVARDLIAAAGYGDHFGHGLGHGIGRTVHDHVALSQRSELTLAPGMVVTVEPGIYIEGWGGVRIEDDVLVTENGREVLTHAPKHLIEV